MAETADALVLFGITGDLAHRKLFRALYALELHGRLNFPVVGVASSPWSEDELHADRSARVVPRHLRRHRRR